jgi:hypothetical protein
MPLRLDRDANLKAYRITWLLATLNAAGSAGVPTADLRSRERDAVAAEQASPYAVVTGSGVGEQYERTRRTRLNRDLAELEERGFVTRFDPETGRTAADGADRKILTRVRVSYPPKREVWHLTRGEHEAINRAREALRPGPARFLSLDGSRRDMTSVDIAMCVLRYFEETGCDTTRRELMNRYDLRSEEVDLVVEALLALRSHVDWWGYSTEPDVIDDRDDGDADVIDPDAPIFIDADMDVLDRFAYTPDEAVERITLIDEALDGWLDLPPADRAPLERAKEKLTAWSDELGIALRPA